MEGIWCGSQSTTLLSVARFTFRANGGKAQAQSLVCDTRTLIQDDLSLPADRNMGPWVTFPVKTRTSKWAERWSGGRPWRTPGEGTLPLKNASSGTRREIPFGSLRPDTDTSPPGLCIIYECWHILRLNICWFVKSTNARSRPSPWHISLADGKQRCTFNWWVPRLVTRSPELPSLPSSAPTEDIQKEEREANKWVGCVRRPACTGQGRSFPSGEDSFLEVPPCTYLRSLLFMFAFTLKHQQHTWRQRWISRGGRVAPFVKTAAGC